MKTPEERKITSGVIVTPENKSETKPIEQTNEMKPKVLFSENLPVKVCTNEVQEERVEVKPKVLCFSPIIKTELPKETVAPTLTPKILFGGKVTAKANSGAKIQETRMAEVKPSIVLANGVARKRIDVSPYELRTTIASLSDEAVIKRAIEHIKVTNLDDGRDEKVIGWGGELQRKLSSLLDEEMRVVQSGTIEGSKQEIALIFSTLQRFDLSGNVSQSSKGGIISSLMKRVRHIDPKAQFDSLYSTLQSAIKKLEGRMPELQNISETVRRLITETEVLTREVEAMIIAGKYLTYYIRSGKYDGDAGFAHLEEQMVTLDQRVESLASTQATLKMSLAQREFLVKNIAHIIDCVQNTLLVDIPAWRTNYLCVLSAIASGNEPDSSIFGQLMEKQNKILERIQV